MDIQQINNNIVEKKMHFHLGTTIDSLIQNEYLKRNESNNDFIDYLA